MFSNAGQLTKMKIWTIFVVLLFSISLSIADDCHSKKILPSTNCTLTLNGSKQSYDIINLRLDLSINDKLTVKIVDLDQKITISEQIFIVLPKAETYVFQLTTSADALERKILSASCLAKRSISIQNLKAFNVFVARGLDTNPVSLILENNHIYHSTLLSSSSTGVKARSSKDAKDEVDLQQSDLLTENREIELIFETKKDDETYFDFNLLQGVKSCSKKIVLNDQPIKIDNGNANDLESQQIKNCIYQIQSDTPLMISDINLGTVHPFDHLQIKDGARLASKDLIHSPVKDVSAILTQLDKRISSSNELIVIFSSFFTPQNLNFTSITLQKSNVKRYETEGVVKIKEDQNTILIFNAAVKTRRPLLTFNSVLKLNEKTRLEVRHSLDMSEKPLMEFAASETVSNQLWSDKNMLVLKFIGQSPALDLKFESIADCDMITSDSSTFTVNGSSAHENQSCNFYFKPRDVIYPLKFHLDSVVLNVGACLSLKSISGQKEIFNICKNSVSDQKDYFFEHNVNEMILSSSDSYMLTFKQANTFKDRLLIQASFAYHPLKKVREFDLTRDNPKQVITSYNYPGNYPYILTKEYLDSVKADSFMFVRFDKCDLREGDSLKLIGSEPKKTLNDFDDLIIGNNNKSELVIVFLDTKFNAAKALSDDHYGTGFQMNFERFECKLEFDTKTMTLSTPGWPNVFVHATKCYAVLDLSDVKNVNYFEATVKSGNQSADYGKLTIFDDPTTHRNMSQLMKVYDATAFKSNGTINMNLTSSKVVLIFEPTSDTSKDLNGFSFTLQKKSCVNSCDDKTRCMLPQIRCNFVSECRDSSDEKNCDPHPQPHPDPKPDPPVEVKVGLPVWVIVFIVIPLSMICGALILLHGPKLMTRVRGYRYHEFNTFTDNA